jgi:signal transduction histidine kinase/ActR/RegA family two-component response regulator
VEPGIAWLRAWFLRGATALPRPLSIRNRLLLLVFAVWLPAVAGIGLLARSTYQREAAAAQERVQQLAQSISSVVERELDKRSVLATTLAASNAVRDGDVHRFHEEALAAVQGTGSWAFLVTASEQLASTLVPMREMRPFARAAGSPLVSGEPGVIFNRQGTVSRRAAIAIFAPEARVTPPRYNVAVAFEPAVMQGVVDQHAYPEGSIASVIDKDQVVMARSRDGGKWLGQSATGDLKRRAQSSQEGFEPSVTLDGVPSLTYLTRPNRYGWAVVIALPRTALAGAAQRVTLQAVTASGLLLVIGLGLALYGSRRISAPVLALRDAAAQLGRDAVPPRLSTGVSEADEVSAALHEAGLRQQQATRTLEQRVSHAVQEAREAQARLLDAQKHETIGRLTGGIAHDFNNLLQTITTGHHVLDRYLPEGPQRRVLQGAMRATAKAADLIRQMLTFGRAQTLKPQPVNLNDLMLKSRELAGKAVGERVALSAAIEPGLPALFVDPVQLELALLNLVFNARDALPQGGRIVIAARLATAEETASLGTGRFVCLQVSDDGLGMDAQTLARAFEPYFTTKPVGAGSGLGLPQAQAFARQSGGDARLASTPGQGTTASLFLPVSEAAAAPLEPGTAPAAPQRPLAILMVEDDVLVSSVVVPALESEGHAVTLCSTADHALELLSQGLPFDVLFTDVVMPGRLTGMDLVAWCRVHRPALPAVVATGYTAQQADLQVQVLRKPYAMEVLLAALQAAVKSRESPPDLELRA